VPAEGRPTIRCVIGINLKQAFEFGLQATSGEYAGTGHQIPAAGIAFR